MSRVLQSTHIQVEKSLQEIFATSGAFGLRQEDIDAGDELCLNYGKIRNRTTKPRIVCIEILF
jgi:hypothetical protein